MLIKNNSIDEFAFPITFKAHLYDNGNCIYSENT